MNLSITRPDERFRDSFLVALDEFPTVPEKKDFMYLGVEEPISTPRRDFGSFVERLRQHETEAKPNFVRTIAFWAIRWYSDDRGIRRGLAC